MVVLEIWLGLETNFWRSRYRLEIDWIFTRRCLVLRRLFLIIFKTSQDHSCRDMNVLNIFFRHSALNEGLYWKIRADLFLTDAEHSRA